MQSTATHIAEHVLTTHSEATEPTTWHISTILCAEGYDRSTALEIAHQTIFDFRCMPADRYTFHTRQSEFTLVKRENRP